MIIGALLAAAPWWADLPPPALAETSRDLVTLRDALAAVEEAAARADASEELFMDAYRRFIIRFLDDGPGTRGLCSSVEAARAWLEADNAARAYALQADAAGARVTPFARLRAAVPDLAVTPQLGRRLDAASDVPRRTRRTLALIRTLYDSQIADELKRARCAGDGLLALATSAPAEPPESAPPPSITAPTAGAELPVHVYVDNTGCDHALALYVDGQPAIVAAPARAESAPATLGWHDLCVASPEDATRCREAPRQAHAWLYDGFTLRPHCSKTAHDL